MQCPDCGYVLTAFDKECPRCAAKRDRSAANPYVAFQNERLPPGAGVALGQAETVEQRSPDDEITASALTSPVSVPARKPKIFLTALWAASLLLLVYHASVVSGMQTTITAQQKQIDDQQKQIDDLRDTVNYNANAVNASRY